MPELVKPELALKRDLRDVANVKEVSWRLQGTSAVMIVFTLGLSGRRGITGRRHRFQKTRL